MNPYVSASEKAQLIRVILMEKVLQDAINVYASLDSTDKVFLAELRHGRTRIDKAVKLRRLSLDKDADDKLIAGAAKLEPMFLARPEARKAHEDIMKLQSTIPMDIEDLQDWYGFVIEFTCENCTKAGYAECPARRILTKYEICPVDPGAKDKCQYSYAAEVSVVEPSVPGMVEKPEFAELGSVSFSEHYAVKKQIEELQEKLNLAEKRFDFQTKECLELFQQNCLLEKQLAELKDKCELWEKTAHDVAENTIAAQDKANEWENAFCKSHNQLTELKTETINILYPEGDAHRINPNIWDIVEGVRDMDAHCDGLHERYDELLLSRTDLQVRYNRLVRDIKADKSGNSVDDVVHEDDSLPVFLGLNNGNKLEMLLPESMAKKLMEDIQRPRSARSICAQYVAGEFVAIDLQEVVAMNVSGLVDADYVKPQANVPAHSFTAEQELYHIQCKCGAEYFATMNAGRTKANCRDCKYTVFADRFAVKVISPTDKIGAVLLTNRYFVTNEPNITQQSAGDRGPVRSNNLSNSRELKPVVELRDIKNVGREYKDPCQLFD